MRAIWNELFSQLRVMHSADQSLSGFCDFPAALSRQEVQANWCPAADLFVAETKWEPASDTKLCCTLQQLAPFAAWGDIYKGTALGRDFLDRFGYFPLIGQGGAFHSDQMAAWVVYMPPYLHYTWHHHPAEEMYRVIAGAGRFMRQGQDDAWLRAGGACEHASNQPHALQTEGSAILAYVIWRNGFASPPVLTR